MRFPQEQKYIQQPPTHPDITRLSTGLEGASRTVMICWNKYKTRNDWQQIEEPVVQNLQTISKGSKLETNSQQRNQNCNLKMSKNNPWIPKHLSLFTDQLFRPRKPVLKENDQGTLWGSEKASNEPVNWNIRKFHWSQSPTKTLPNFGCRH